MSLDDRLGYFIFGCFIGFILGLIVAYLRNIKETVDEVDEIVKKRSRNESGFVRNPIALDLAFLFVVVITVWSAIASQVSSNRSNDTADRVIELQLQQKRILDCTTQVVFDSIRALNERTTYSGEQIDSNIGAWEAQLNLLLKGQKAGATRAEQLALYQDYIAKVKTFVEVSHKTKDQQELFPFPTVKDLTNCLAQRPNDDASTPSDGSSPTPSTE